jgi:hypothetical protein
VSFVGEAASIQATAELLDDLPQVGRVLFEVFPNLFLARAASALLGSARISQS